MKKIIGILGIVVLALTLFINTTNEANDLASLLTTSIANADISEGSGCRFTDIYADRCVKSGFEVTSCVNNTETQTCGWDPVPVIT